MALFIRNVTLIDGTGAAPVESASIAIEGDQIASVGRNAQVPGGAQEIDGTRLYVTPGLIDTHVHTELVGREALPVWLGTGVTTVRDLGGALEFLLETRRMLEGGMVGPRVLFTGPMIDGVPPTWPTLVNSVPDAETAVRTVDEYLAAGADAIKLYTTLPPESVKRCIERVDRRVPVTGHLGATWASQAMEAGISGLEHALLTPYNDFAPEGQASAPDETMMSPGFWARAITNWPSVDLNSEKSKRWIDLLVARDVSLCPTLTLMPGTGDEADPVELQYSVKVQERWLQATQQRQAAQAATPPEFQRVARAARAKLQELVAVVHRAGGRVVSGTDTGAIASLVPGFALHRELGYLSDAGIPNMDVLRCATARAAEALWRDDLGAVQPGKRADLLLLRSNPLDDVRNLRDIQLVIKDGLTYDPAQLLAGAQHATS